MPNLDPIIIACAADDAFAMPLTVMVCSLLSNLDKQRQILLFVIDGGLANFRKQKIAKSFDSKNISIKWVSPEHYSFSKLKISGHIQPAAYFRILLPQLLPNSIKKVIYLDGDLLVLGDIVQLWDLDITDTFLLAVQDMGEPYVSSPRALNNFEELGIPADYRYFNSGVMVINLDHWRAERISLLALNYLEKNKAIIRWWDQDALNAVLAGRWSELDPRWNQIPHIFEYPSWEESPFDKETYYRIITNPFIIHFATSSKPWHYDCKHPAKKTFFEYLDKTAWSGWRPKKSIQANLLRRLFQKAAHTAQRLVRFTTYER